MSATGPRRLVAAALGVGVALVTSTAVAAHEERQIAGYDVEVGMIDEPVYVGQKSGLEVFVNKDEKPVDGLESTLKAEVIKGDRRMQLDLSPRFGQEGAYESVFIPTAAGPYTFHLTGTIEGSPVDQSFTSSPDGFSEVNEAAAGQFPAQLPALADVAADAQRGADAAGMVTLALAGAGAAIVIGLLALGLAVAAGRRRPAT
jgi:hypothetical protein